MKILITGATGFVGSALVSLLKKQGHQLVLVGHHVSAHETAEIHAVNLEDQIDWQPLLHGCDVVVHLAARVHVMKENIENATEKYYQVNVEATQQLAEQALKAGVKRFVYLSSLKVNGEFNANGRAFDEGDAPNPVGPYAQSKHKAEQILFELAKNSALEVTVIRPPLVYGPNVRANFYSLLSIVYKQIPLPLAQIKNLRSYVYVENLVDFIEKCLEHPQAVNQCFFVSDSKELTTTQLIRACADALGVKTRLFYFPQGLLRLVCKLFRKDDFYQRLCGDLTVNINKANRLLGWKPPYTVEAGLFATAAAFKHKNTNNK
jgi:nucleoside-diphosphate-sugar epimerase